MYSCTQSLHYKPLGNLRRALWHRLGTCSSLTAEVDKVLMIGNVCT